MYETVHINSALEAENRPGISREFVDFFRRLRVHANLIWQLTMRDALGRYQGSHLGALWSILNPLGLLAVESVVFGLIFKARFTHDPHEGPMDYALALFAALMVFNVFAEAFTRSPGLIVTQPNYVTRVIFPLEILSITIVLSAMVNMCISLLPLLVGELILRGHIPWTMWVWPVLMPPVFCFCLGLSWIMSAVGVFLRDLNASIIVLLNIVMYGSAIFYSVDKVPATMLPFVKYNPLAAFVQQSRNMAVWGALPDWHVYWWVCFVSAAMMVVGYVVFTRLRGGFADVL